MKTSNQGEKHFAGMLGLYLRQRKVEESINYNQKHLDEDILSAFVEGSLNQYHAAPVIKHLVNCASCRRITAQLTRLAEALDGTQIDADAIRTSNWRELWSNLTESVFRPYDNAVVAHEEEKEPKVELVDKSDDN